MGVNFATGGRPFADPDDTFSNLEAGLVAHLVTASADIALLVDTDGIVTDVAMRESVCAPEIYRAWIGSPFVDIVTSESRLKAKRLLSENDDQRRREINHPIPGQADLPVSYSVLPLTKKGARIALGRDLRSISDLQQKLIEAQLAYDAEFERIRAVEAQYRLLFETAADIRLVIDPSTRHVLEANAAAKAAFSAVLTSLVGASVERLFAQHSLSHLDQLVASAFSSGKMETAVLARAEPLGDPITVSARFFRHHGASRLSLQIAPASASPIAPGDEREALFARLGRQSPDAIVLLDRDMRIVLVNESMLDLLQIPDIGQAIGQSVEGRIGHRGVELSVLRNAIDAQGFVRNLSATLTPLHGASVPIDISGTAVERDGMRYYGLSIRRRERGSHLPQASEQEFRPANDMIGLIGQMPLRDIVRDTTDIIERLCIEAALELTGNNRASTAELLGLSRQALYTKLRRFNIHGDNGAGRATPEQGVDEATD